MLSVWLARQYARSKAERPARTARVCLLWPFVPSCPTSPLSLCSRLSVLEPSSTRHGGCLLLCGKPPHCGAPSALCTDAVPRQGFPDGPPMEGSPSLALPTRPPAGPRPKAWPTGRRASHGGDLVLLTYAHCQTTLWHGTTMNIHRMNECIVVILDLCPRCTHRWPITVLSS